VEGLAKTTKTEGLRMNAEHKYLGLDVYRVFPSLAAKANGDGRTVGREKLKR
jgi:hypothetical protein